MKRKKAGRVGLDRERARRLELDRSNAERRLADAVAAVETPVPLGPRDAAPILGPAAASDRADRDSTSAGVRLPGQRVECLWCGSSTPVKRRGPLPRFCSANCRHRAWEQERAARAGRAAVITSDRFVATYPGSSETWATHLERLAADVRNGRLDGQVLTGALDAVFAAIAYRQRDDESSNPWWQATPGTVLCAALLAGHLAREGGMRGSRNVPPDGERPNFAEGPPVSNVAGRPAPRGTHTGPDSAGAFSPVPASKCSITDAPGAAWALLGHFLGTRGRKTMRNFDKCRQAQFDYHP